MSIAGDKTLFHFEITHTANKQRAKVQIMTRVSDGDGNQTKWERIGTLGVSKECWEQLEGILVLGMCEAGVLAEFDESVMQSESESDWARARREAQEDVVKEGKRRGVTL